MTDGGCGEIVSRRPDPPLQILILVLVGSGPGAGLPLREKSRWLFRVWEELVFSSGLIQGAAVDPKGAIARSRTLWWLTHGRFFSIGKGAASQ